jgi:hypothetical protein
MCRDEDFASTPGREDFEGLPVVEGPLMFHMAFFPRDGLGENLTLVLALRMTPWGHLRISS